MRDCDVHLLCQQVVVVSPLMRTCETAAGVFGGASSGSSDAGLLMKNQADARLERSAHDAIALPAGLPFISEELVRERMGDAFAAHSGPNLVISHIVSRDLARDGSLVPPCDPPVLTANSHSSAASALL